MSDEEVTRPEVLAGPTSGRLPAGTGDATGPEGVPDPRNLKAGPGQKGYGPGGPQIGSNEAPLSEVDIAALADTLGELKSLRESMLASPQIPEFIRVAPTGLFRPEDEDEDGNASAESADNADNSKDEASG